MALDPAILRNELDALTRELSQLLRNADARRVGAGANPEPIAAAFDVLGNGLADADLQPERLIRTRPILATAAAFTVGVAIGLLLRRT